MAVTKQTYTATATWTASGLADIFRDAFIDAGLMSAWHDSFLNTIENRILEVQYNGAKTYGKTYYWFQFTTSGVFLSHASGWNATTHVPTGTQYLDYYSTTTSATSNHRQLVTLAAGTTTTLTRFTSADSGGATWFVVVNGSTNFPFTIDKPSVTFPSWMDLDKIFHLGFYSSIQGTTDLRGSGFAFASLGGFRRTVHSIGMSQQTSVNEYISFTQQYGYVLAGDTANAAWNFGTTHTSSSPSLEAQRLVILPSFTTASNPAYSANQTPAFTGLPISFYCSSSLTSDIAIIPDWTNSGMNVGDRLIISGGGEWEIMQLLQSAAVGQQPSMIFGARVV